MSRIQKIKIISDQRGMLSVDFLFSLILASLLSMMLLAMSSTFTVVEIVQYIAFSGARAGSSADVDIESQKARAQKKVSDLLNNKSLKSLFSNNWFAVSLKDIRLGGNSSSGGNPEDHYGEIYKPQKFSDKSFIPAVGLRLSFEAKVLDFKIPFLGRSKNDQTEQGFISLVTGFLMREPSQKECMDLMSASKRMQPIFKLDPRYEEISKKNNFTDDKYFPSEDNGC